MDYTGTFDGTDDAVQLANQARDNAYAPFDEPDEGAVFVTDAGHGVVGSRVENSNFTNTIHAVETALGDLLETDSDPSYLVISTDGPATPTQGRAGSFLKSKPALLYEFVDGDFPVIVHEDGATAQQYTVDDIVRQAEHNGLQGGSTPGDLPTFDVDAPYTMIDAEDAVDRVDAWRDAAYDALADRMEDIDYDSDDPIDDVMREAKDAFMAVDERPDDVLEELHDYAEDAQQDAYEPISGYPVGVSLLDRNGRVFTGQNMEDADIGNTMHGEGNTLSTAVTWGMERGDPVMLTVHSESDDAPFPCGLCRQTAAEFADGDTVLGAVGKDGSGIEEYSTLDRHLPDLFRL